MNASGFSDRDDPFHPGDIVEDRYRVLRKLSAGGVGAVYEVEHVFTGLRVALKALHNQHGDHPERMRAEARTLAEMRHPNIVQITDGGASGRTVWFTMELLEGRTLREELMQRGPLGLARALRFGLQIAEAVAAAHALQVIHRDLKPENIFVVTESDSIKILDFGTSKITNRLKRSAMLKTTDRFRLIGTQAYMPPERLKAGLADARADVYALGHMLYEMIAGRHCWSGGPGPLDLPPPHELGLLQIYTSPRSIREHAPEVPEWIDELVLTALAKDPEHRQQTMQAMVDTLRAALARLERELPVEPVRPARAPAPPAHGGLALTTERVPALQPFGEPPMELPTRELPLRAAAPRPFQGSESRAKIDALLARGAARFGARSPEPGEVERAFEVIARAEASDPERRGMLRSIAHASASSNERWREVIREIASRIARNEGDERETVMGSLLRSLEKRGWTPDTADVEPLPHAEVALGAALLLPPEQRLDSAESGLIRLPDLDADVQALAVSVMVAFARTEPATHPAARGALLALLLGGAEDSELARSELAQFVLSAAAVSDRSPTVPRVASRAARPAEPAPARTSPGAPLVAPTRTAQPTPVRAAAKPPASPVRRRTNLVWVVAAGALASSLVLLAGFALRTPAREPAVEASAKPQQSVEVPVSAAPIEPSSAPAVSASSTPPSAATNDTLPRPSTAPRAAPKPRALAGPSPSARTEPSPIRGLPASGL